MDKINFDQKLKEFQDILKLPREMRWMRDGFTITPNSVLTADISRELKLLYVILLMYGFKKQSCFPSIKSLARAVGADERTIRRNLRRLEGEGWIKVKYRNGQSSVYTLMKGGH